MEGMAGVGKLEVVAPVVLKDLLDLLPAKTLDGAAHEGGGWDVLGDGDAGPGCDGNGVECRLFVVAGHVDLLLLLGVNRLEVGAKTRVGVAAGRRGLGSRRGAAQAHVFALQHEVVIVPVLDHILDRLARLQA